jgi:hypothetical protein
MEAIIVVTILNVISGIPQGHSLRFEGSWCTYVRPRGP